MKKREITLQTGEFPAEDSESTILLFDGVCHFCHAAVHFIIRRDPEARVRFASMQSEVGKRLLKKAGLDPARLSTVVLYDHGRVYVKSDAVLRVCRKLNGLWPLLYGGIVIPRRIRDAFYDGVARNRYRWFGQTEQCRVPDRSERFRFLDL
jgi:predicted DCC family thiol-disulfide oxidoreductase YuxK